MKPKPITEEYLLHMKMRGMEADPEREVEVLRQERFDLMEEVKRLKKLLVTG